MLWSVSRLERLQLGGGGGAWSITGPYGSGKSSLALLLDSAFGKAGPIRERALELLSAATPDLASLVVAAHQRHDTVELGFFTAVATAQREPIGHTVLRALHSAVVRRFGRLPPQSQFKAVLALKNAMADAASNDPRRAGPSVAAILEVALGIAESAPLLILIDEFGKNLEAIGTSADADPYLLQQLAEAGQTCRTPIFTVTLQHLSFEDYFTTVDSPKHREWAKVQGRFEAVPFADSPAQIRAFITGVFEVGDAIRERVDNWADGAAKAMGDLDIAELATPEAVAGCFPLHPLAVVVLPELCSRYGQNERTLFSFLSGNEATAVPALLGQRELTEGPLPVVGLAEIYDYFIAEGAIAGSLGAHASRWMEIATCLRDAHGLSATESRIAKSIAVLNLVGASGTIRASSTALAQISERSASALEKLTDRGLITYRAFADEYRIWQGSDLDVRHLYECAASGLAKLPLIDVLARLDAPTPVIAARHSAESDTLRVFTRRYATASETVVPPDPFSDADGELLLVVDSNGDCPTLNSSDRSQPVVAAMPISLVQLDAAARSLAAIHQVVEMPEVAADWVVRNELGEQLAEAELRFHDAWTSTFDPQRCAWYLLTSDGLQELPSGRGTTALSAAADCAYRAAPLIGNEMINRTDMTTQGAKARRMLLTAMIERSGEVDLGLQGYGPEVAMYRAVLDRTGMHRRKSGTGGRVFAEPSEPSMRLAWQELEMAFTRAKSQRVNLIDVYRVLMSPPIGMKAAVVPVFVTAGLLVHHDEIAIYEHGTFKATLQADMSERMVKNPIHFEIKHYANASGARRKVIQALAIELGVTRRSRKHRVGNVLAVVANIIGVVQRLDNFTRKTSALSDSALAARDVLTTAIEPDELLFERLPEALGFAPVRATKPYPRCAEYVRAVRDAVEELNGCTRRLQEELLGLILRHAREPSRRALSGQASAISHEIIDPGIRSFVLAMSASSFDDDLQWTNNVATVVAKRAVGEWSDGDRARFEFELPAKMAAFRRLLALHVEHRAADGNPFNALRVTVTRPDGNEVYLMLTLDDHMRNTVGDSLEVVVGELAAVLGSEADAREAILATLAEQVLPSAEPIDGSEIAHISTVSAAHG